MYFRDIILDDPTLLEESVADAYLMIGLNAYKELCGFYLRANASKSPELILKASSIAASKTAIVIEQIKESIAQELKLNLLQNNELVGFEHGLHFNKEIAVAKETLASCLDKWRKPKKKNKQVVKEAVKMDLEPAEVHSIGKDSAVLLPPVNKMDHWNISSNESEAEEPEMPEIKSEVIKGKMDAESDGSEEEQVVVLNADKNTIRKRKYI